MSEEGLLQATAKRVTEHFGERLSLMEMDDPECVWIFAVDGIPLTLRVREEQSVTGFSYKRTGKFFVQLEDARYSTVPFKQLKVGGINHARLFETIEYKAVEGNKQKARAAERQARDHLYTVAPLMLAALEAIEEAHKRMLVPAHLIDKAEDIKHDYALAIGKVQAALQAAREGSDE